MQTTAKLKEIQVPAREGRAIQLRQGDRVRVIDLDGGQVGDVFAFSQVDITEYHSAAHTRAKISRLFPLPGEVFVTNKRRPILSVVEDSSPGRHDMLMAACDPERYALLGDPFHASCAANLRVALADLGLVSGVVPQPINVFMNIPVDPAGGLQWLPASTCAGDSITFEALMDCVFVVSACPQDLTSINHGEPTALALEIARARRRVETNAAGHEGDYRDD